MLWGITHEEIFENMLRLLIALVYILKEFENKMVIKGARAELSNSDMYRSIAISSLRSKMFDNVIIERQQDFLSTSNYQFGFKAKSSTVLRTTMVNETIQYYIGNGGQAVYLLLLEASKAFDKVSYEKLFELLLARNVCPKIVKLLYYMYTHKNVMSDGIMNNLILFLNRME